MKLIEPKIIPPLDEEFRPAILSTHTFLEAVSSSGEEAPLTIFLERSDESTSSFSTRVFAKRSLLFENNFSYVEKLVKTLLWQRGGMKIIIGGEKEIGEHIKRIYSKDGKYSFDVNIMSRIYEKPFTVEILGIDNVPQSKEKTLPLGGEFSGCRLGFDLGASDIKVAASLDGEVVFSEEIVWHPKEQTTPQYHYNIIMQGLKKAASYLPKVDAIGGSAAGVYIDNRVRVASIFRGIPEDIFEKEVKNFFINMQKDWGNIPLVVVNDGEVAALAGALTLGVNKILGVALGSSFAAGYINSEGKITDWLNELAFVPMDLSPDAPRDDWSGDRGCAVQYLSQAAVIRLAEKVGITYEKFLSPAEKLKYIQELLIKNDHRISPIFETIGVYLGYAIAYFCHFYDIDNALILGRVVSGVGGNIILTKTKEVLQREFSHLHNRITLHLPDEKLRRVGQAVAAASLPIL